MKATHDFTGGNTAWAGFVPNGQGFGQTPVPDGSDDLLLTPVGVGTTINGNANAAGVSGGGGSGLGIGSGEAIRLDFVNDLTGNPAGSGGFDDPANRDFVFADHYEVNGAVVSFGGINVGSAAARFTAKDDPDRWEQCCGRWSYRSRHLRSNQIRRGNQNCRSCLTLC